MVDCGFGGLAVGFGGFLIYLGLVVYPFVSADEFWVLVLGVRRLFRKIGDVI